MNEYMALSNFGVHYFIGDFVDANTVPAGETDCKEIMGIISANFGGVNKQIQTVKQLNSDGWDTVISLGQSQAEASLDLIRTGTGNVYTGAEGESTYTLLKHWVDNATAQGGVNAPKTIVELIPRGENVYEGTAFYVVPTAFTNGQRSTDGGQTYSVNVQPFGKPISLTVTKDEESGKFKFVKA